MNKKPHYYHVICLILPLICIWQHIQADAVITFFLRPYPENHKPMTPERGLNKINQPQRWARAISKQFMWNPQLISGIMVSYAGFLTSSDLNGQVTLPRKHDKPALSLLITEEVTPIVRSGNTLSHWELEQGTPARMYKATLDQDHDTKLWYWNITEQPVPTNNIIPLDAIIFFAHPDYVYVPEGVTITPENQNMILPPLYIKKGINFVDSALYIINLAHYYGSLFSLYKKGPKEYQSHITD